MSTAKVIVTVKVDDGSFESGITFPVASTEEERRGAITLWIAMLEQAIKVGT